MADNQTSIPTYMLLGNDNDDIDPKKVDPDNPIIVIRASDFPALTDAARQVKAPANVIIGVHNGYNAKFAWIANTTTSPDYSFPHIFDNLPQRGIGAIVLEGCYTQVVETPDLLKHAPPGALVIPIVGSLNTTDQFVEGKLNSSLDPHTDAVNPTIFYLKALNALIPAEYKKNGDDDNKENHKHDSSDPLYAVPSVIGIGGNPPKLINMDDQGSAMRVGKSSTEDSRPINEKDWKSAVALVQQNFDPGKAEEIQRVADRFRDPYKTLIRYDKHGKQDDVKTAENVRIGYALAAAYLHTSGQMDTWRQQQIDQAANMLLIPPPPALDPVIDKKFHILEDLIRNEQPVDRYNQEPRSVAEAKAFAAEFHIPMSKGTVLTDMDILHLQQELHIVGAKAKPPGIDVKTLDAMEATEISGHLPTPQLPKSKMESIQK